MPAADESQSNAQVAMFQSIQREATLSERVAQQIEKIIVDGQLQRGEQLPPERELAKRFGVSRTVVREAMRGLAAKHLIEIRAGSGTIITGPTVHSVSLSMSLLLSVGGLELSTEKVLEVRRLLEVEIAALAAERRTADDLKKIEEALSHQVSMYSDRDGFAQSDVDFHTALAAATHNEMFEVMLNSISNVMMEMRRIAFVVPGTPERGIAYHQAVFEQVKNGDAEGARQAMRAHLVEAEETMRQATALMAEHASPPEDQAGQT